MFYLSYFTNFLSLVEGQKIGFSSNEMQNAIQNVQSAVQSQDVWFCFCFYTGTNIILWEMNLQHKIWRLIYSLNFNECLIKFFVKFYNGWQVIFLIVYSSFHRLGIISRLVNWLWLMITICILHIHVWKTLQLGLC